jgi:uncharacterized protein YggE
VAQEVSVSPEHAAVVAGGRGEVTLRPDRASVSLTVRTIAPEPDAAASRNETTTEAVTAALDALALEPDSIRLTGLRIGPNREYTPEGPRDDGFFAERNIRVSTDDIADVARIVSAAVNAGATQVDYVGYSSSREEEARREALEKAVAKARADAEVVARAAGGRLGAVILLSTQEVTVPMPMYRLEADARGMEMSEAQGRIPEPEDLTISAFVTGHWAFAAGR